MEEDLTMFHLENIIDDLARRDFTINAMAIDSKGLIIDEFGGENDLQNNIIRSVGNANERIARRWTE